MDLLLQRKPRFLDEVELHRHSISPQVRLQYPILLTRRDAGAWGCSLVPQIALGPRWQRTAEEARFFARTALPGGTLVTTSSRRETSESDWGYEGQVGLGFVVQRSGSRIPVSIVTNTGYSLQRDFDGDGQSGYFVRLGGRITW